MRLPGCARGGGVYRTDGQGHPSGETGQTNFKGRGEVVAAVHPGLRMRTTTIADLRLDSVRFIQVCEGEDRSGRVGTLFRRGSSRRARERTGVCSESFNFPTQVHPRVRGRLNGLGRTILVMGVTRRRRSNVFACHQHGIIPHHCACAGEYAAAAPFR